MGKTNGKSETRGLDLEHELPPSDDPGEDQKIGEGSGAGTTAPAGAELEKLKVERDALLDRMARMQADFDNARKRAAREQQDYREYALMDAVKTILPILDSFDRALQTSNPEAA